MSNSPGFDLKTIASQIPLTLWAGKFYHFDKCLLQIARGFLFESTHP